MLATILLVACALVLIGKRADRVYEARAVNEFGAGRGSDTKGAGSPDIPRPTLQAVSLTAPRPTGLYRGKPAAYWAFMYRERTRQLQQARRALRHRPTVTEAINLACVVYGNCDTLWRKARCESNLNPGARNASEAAGLFQFIPSTWRSTPFAGFSIYSPYANALAAGWMHSAGRGGEWSCR